MPPAPPTGEQISSLCAPARPFYVHFTDPMSTHNDHQVVAWALLQDMVTVVPLIISTDDGATVVEATSISQNYQVMNPSSECAYCVRPELA